MDDLRSETLKRSGEPPASQPWRPEVRVRLASVATDMAACTREALNNLEREQRSSGECLPLDRVVGIFIAQTFDILQQAGISDAEIDIAKYVEESTKITGRESNNWREVGVQASTTKGHIHSGYNKLVESIGRIKDATTVETTEQHMAEKIKRESKNNTFVDIATSGVILTHAYIIALTAAYKTEIGRSGGFTDDDCVSSAEIRGRKLSGLLLSGEPATI